MEQDGYISREGRGFNERTRNSCNSVSNTASSSLKHQKKEGKRIEGGQIRYGGCRGEEEEGSGRSRWRAVDFLVTGLAGHGNSPLLHLALFTVASTSSSSLGQERNVMMPVQSLAPQLLLQYP